MQRPRSQTQAQGHRLCSSPDPFLLLITEGTGELGGTVFPRLCPKYTANLKTKGRGRGNAHLLFEIKEELSGKHDAGRSPETVLIWRRGRGDVYEKRKGNYSINKKEHVDWCRQENSDADAKERCFSLLVP